MSSKSEEDEELRERVSRITTRSGVYLMRSASGEVLYIGKAKNLRSRVRQYFSGGDGRTNIEYLVSRVADVETIVTENEHHAFVLERDLITKYKPRYNIRLKDDKAYLNVRIDTQAEWPRLELVRQTREDGALYFGPYTFSYELRTLLDLIKRVVPLRTCRDTVLYNRQRPCLEYQIQRCSGPCCLPVDKDQYREWIDQAISILQGETAPLVSRLEKLMEEAAEDLRFEDAARCRDRIEILQKFTTRQSLVTSGGENRDVFALYREEGLAVLSILLVRNGRIADSKSFSFEGIHVPDEEVFEAAVGQYYGKGGEIPEEVILPVELENGEMLEAELREKRGAKVELLVPKRGVKFRLCGLASLNAKEQFVSRFDAESRYLAVAERLALVCKLKQVPRRVECVDISNLGGDHIVGAVVSFYDGSPDKKRYRKFRVQAQSGQDDFAAIREVVERHLKGALEKELLPDLFIIDGGKQQLEKALEAREEAGASVEIVSLAKMRTKKGKARPGSENASPERIFLPGQSAPIPLDPSSELSHFVQRVRDEVHRFVIQYHRSSRRGALAKSLLDEVPGVGTERRKRLLNTFRSLEEIRNASPIEISKRAKMPLVVAERLLEHLEAAAETERSGASAGKQKAGGEVSEGGE